MGTVYYQDLKIDWGKATKEYVFEGFENKDELDKDDSYLYREQLKQLLNWTGNYLNAPEEDKNINNIFSIVGDRGTGKSSFVQSAKEALKRDAWAEDREEKKIYVLPTIDPTIFDGRINILELFVAMLKSEVDEIVLKNEKLNNQEFQNVAQFNKNVKEIISVLKTMRIDKSAFAEKNSGVEVLYTLQEQQNFFGKMSELIKCFLPIVKTKKIKYTHICLSIDDLDLVPNCDVYNTLQNIFKFLKCQQNLVILIAYRKEQLVNSVMDALIQGNSELLKHEEVNTTELREQAANFIEKGLPRPQQIVLEIEQKTRILDILQPFIDSDQKKDFKKLFERLSYGSGTDLTFRQFVQSIIMEQVRIQIDPVDAFELTTFVYPTNLRGTLQLLEVIHQFDNFQKLVDSEFANHISLSTLDNNIIKYRQYLFNVFSDTLPKSLNEIVTEWQSREYTARNSFICTKLLDLMKDNILEDVRNQFEVIKNKQSYNVSLGDVFAVFEFYKRQYKHSEEYMHFLYAMKMTYSLEMLRLLVRAIKNFYVKEVNLDADINYGVRSESFEQFYKQYEEISKKIELDNYFAIANGKIIPDGFYYSKNLISGVDRVAYSGEEAVDLVIYSDISASGDIRKDNLKAYDHYRKGYQYQYRNIFRKIEFTKDNSYLIDLFSQLTDTKSVITNISEVHKSGGSNYLFYSMFDLDFFIRKNYSRRSHSSYEMIEYAVERVNRCFTGKLRNLEEKEMQRKMVLPLFNKLEQLGEDGCRVFIPLFGDVKRISNLISNVNQEKIPTTSTPEEDLEIVKEKELLKLILKISEALNTDEIKPKREAAKRYFDTFNSWPNGLAKNEVDLMNNLISKSRSQKFSSLDDNLKQLRHYLEGLNSILVQKQKKAEEKKETNYNININEDTND